MEFLTVLYSFIRFLVFFLVSSPSTPLFLSLILFLSLRLPSWSMPLSFPSLCLRLYVSVHPPSFSVSLFISVTLCRFPSLFFLCERFLVQWCNFPKVKDRKYFLLYRCRDTHLPGMNDSDNSPIGSSLLHHFYWLDHFYWLERQWTYWGRFGLCLPTRCDRQRVVSVPRKGWRRPAKIVGPTKLSEKLLGK